MTSQIRYFFTLILLYAGTALAQTGGISGTVKTSDGNPAAGVSITIKGTNIGTLTNDNGVYRITRVKAGVYTLEASLVGLEKKELAVTVVTGTVAQANFTLKENSSALNEVNVSSRKARNSTIVAKMPLADIENPQVSNSVSSDLMKTQGIVNFDDAMRNIPGISRTWESTGREGDGAAYFALRGFDAQPVLTNGLPGLTNGNLDIANVEEIQVIKGPSATLFGGSVYAYGGLINTITKKPKFNTFSGEVAYNTGSFGLHRVSADVNTPLGKKVAFRLYTAYHTEKSFQDAGFKKSFFVAPSIAWEVNDRLTISAMMEILSEKRAVPPVFFHTDRASALPFTTIEALNLDPKQSFTSNDLTIKNPRLNFQAQAVYKLSDVWTSQTVVSGGNSKSQGIYSYIYEDAIPTDNLFDYYFHVTDYSMKTLDIQQNFNGDFKIGNMRNRLLIGLDHYRRTAIDNGSGWAVGRKVNPQGGVFPYEDDNGVERPPIPLTRSAVDALLGPPGTSASKIQNSSSSIYVSDVINFTPKFLAMASLRADRFDSKGDISLTDDDYSQNALSPKLGLLYQPVLNKVSIFVNYMNAFINVAPASFTDPVTGDRVVKSLKPERANQWEFGVKTNLSDKFTATVSYYDIKVKDRVNYDAANVPVQNGTVRSRGFEIDLSAHPVTGLDIIAGYSHNSNKVIVGNGTDFYAEVGSAAGGQGPADQINLWATYRFVNGPLKNFGAGAGGNYASKYRVVDNSVTGRFDLPSYTLLNGTVFYNSRKYRVNFNVNNITDKQYYIGYWSVNPQKQRNFTATIAYKF